MKLSLKSKNIDLELESDEKLEDILKFLDRFFKLHAKAEYSRRQAHVEIAQQAKSPNKRTKAK